LVLIPRTFGTIGTPGTFGTGFGVYNSAYGEPAEPFKRAAVLIILYPFAFILL
jgi:hypothetical protein